MNSDLYGKLITLMKKHHLDKQANILSDFLHAKPKELVTQCPICGDEPDPECILCDGDGELVSKVEPDDEDDRVAEELHLK